MTLPFDAGVDEKRVVVKKKDRDDVIVPVAVPQLKAIPDLVVGDIAHFRCFAEDDVEVMGAGEGGFKSDPLLVLQPSPLLCVIQNDRVEAGAGVSGDLVLLFDQSIGVAE